ncbi:hypothetical protein ACFWN7_05140 [Agromyces sp. NPDC058484]|uniref:hypothetical protein n=1 Tax=Agromyces sp. NPDC058484 TaxID=3346524 RepID=UPI003646D9E0
MISLTEPQIWAVIGVLAASLVGTITLTTQLMMRAVSAQIGGLRNEMVARFEHVDRRFEQVDRRFERVEDRLDRFEERMGRLEHRVDAIDRDVQAIARKVFPSNEE